MNPIDSSTIRKLILVKGRVQGVYFRAYTLKQAKQLGLVGFVMNTQNGDVCIEAEGNLTAVNALIAWCKKGSPLSNVNSVEDSELPLKHETEFVIN